MRSNKSLLSKYLTHWKVKLPIKHIAEEKMGKKENEKCYRKSQQKLIQSDDEQNTIKIWKIIALKLNKKSQKEKLHECWDSKEKSSNKKKKKKRKKKQRKRNNKSINNLKREYPTTKTTFRMKTNEKKNHHHVQWIHITSTSTSTVTVYILTLH